MRWEKGKIKEYEQNIIRTFLKAKKRGKVIQKMIKKGRRDDSVVKNISSFSSGFNFNSSQIEWFAITLPPAPRGHDIFGF